jgi:hypothetical protein
MDYTVDVWLFAHLVLDGRNHVGCRCFGYRPAYSAHRPYFPPLFCFSSLRPLLGVLPSVFLRHARGIHPLCLSVSTDFPFSFLSYFFSPLTVSASISSITGWPQSYLFVRRCPFPVSFCCITALAPYRAPPPLAPRLPLFLLPPP